MHELAKLKKLVYEQHLRIVEGELVILSEGNVSQITPNRQFVIIKPSGVLYDQLSPESMVVVALSGEVYEGQYKPSVDTETHLEIYRKCPEVYGIVHTHSLYATMFAQAKEPLPCYGTTHADRFNGAVPITRDLTEQELQNNYAKQLGASVVEVLRTDIPAVLVSGHGVFTVGPSAPEAVDTALILEKVAKMAVLKKPQCSLNEKLFNSHYERKYGVTRHYGQD